MLFCIRRRGEKIIKNRLSMNYQYKSYFCTRKSVSLLDFLKYPYEKFGYAVRFCVMAYILPISFRIEYVTFISSSVGGAKGRRACPNFIPVIFSIAGRIIEFGRILPF